MAGLDPAICLPRDGRVKPAMTMATGGTQMLTAEENDLLCRAEGDASMGQIVRLIADRLRERLGVALEELAVSPIGRAAE
jgi:hypothetical protein